MTTNLVYVCPSLSVDMCVSSGQQPCHSMHIYGGIIYKLLSSFENLTRKNLNLRDVREGFGVDKEQQDR